MTQPTVLGLLQRSPAIRDLFASQKEELNQQLSRTMSRNAYLEVETLIRNMSGSLMRHYQAQAESFSIPAFLSSAILEGDSFEGAIRMISFLRDKGFKGHWLDICEALCYLDTPSSSYHFDTLRNRHATQGSIEKMQRQHPELSTLLGKLLDKLPSLELDRPCR